LTTSVRDVLPKARAIYDQAKTPVVDSVGHTLVPIDLGDLGNDVDGCRLRVITVHKQTVGAMYSNELHLWVQQAGFTDADSTNFNAGITTWLIFQYLGNTAIAAGSTRLTPTTISAQGDNFVNINPSGTAWVRFYNYYRGDLRSGDSNRENNASTAQGPAILMNITSIVTGTNKLTITVDNPHAIQVGNSVTLAGISGAPSALGTKTVTAQPDRTSFEVALTGAAGTYSGGTVSYVPSFNKYRIWAAVHPDVSARFIVSDR
jgi:hypothetical protein